MKNEKLLTMYLVVAKWLQATLIVDNDLYNELSKLQFECSHDILHAVCNNKTLYNMQVHFTYCIEYLNAIKYSEGIENIIDSDTNNIDLKALSMHLITAVLWSAYKNTEQANIEFMISDFANMLANSKTVIIYSADNEIID